MKVLLILLAIVLIAILTIYILARKQYKDEVDLINRTEYKGYQLMAIGFLIQDIEILSRYFSKVNNHIMQLYGKYEYSYRNRLYRAEKIGISYFLMIIILIFTLMMGVRNLDTNFTTNFNKPEFGEGQEKYNYTYKISIDDSVIQDDINIVIPEKQGSIEEGNELLTQVAQKLSPIILGENESVSYVDYPLNLIEVYGDRGITIEWESENEYLLLNNGEIRYNNLEENGNHVVLKGVISYYEQRYEVVYDLMLYKTRLTNEEKLQRAKEELNYLLSKDQLEQREEEVISLPDEISDEEINVEWIKNKEQTNLIYILVAGILSIVFIGALKDYDLKKKVEDKKQQMLSEFPELVNKMTLLINAGMTVSKAFAKICSDYSQGIERGGAVLPLYEEMLVTIEDMDKGTSEVEAYESFGKRCKLPEILRFTSVLIQNLRKGSNSLVSALRQQSKEAWSLREDIARKKGEKASTRLVLPMGIMLIAIIIIVLVPAGLALRV